MKLAIHRNQCNTLRIAYQSDEDLWVIISRGAHRLYSGMLKPFKHSLSNSMLHAIFKTEHIVRELFDANSRISVAIREFNWLIEASNEDFFGNVNQMFYWEDYIHKWNSFQYLHLSSWIIFTLRWFDRDLERESIFMVDRKFYRHFPWWVLANRNIFCQ